MIGAVDDVDQRIRPKHQRDTWPFQDLNCFMLRVLNTTFIIILIFAEGREIPLLSDYASACCLPPRSGLRLWVVCSDKFRCTDFTYDKSGMPHGNVIRAEYTKHTRSQGDLRKELKAFITPYGLEACKEGFTVHSTSQSPWMCCRGMSPVPFQRVFGAELRCRL
jgi:hypothetical protein